MTCTLEGFYCGSVTEDVFVVLRNLRFWGTCKDWSSYLFKTFANMPKIRDIIHIITEYHSKLVKKPTLTVCPGILGDPLLGLVLGE